MQREFLYMTNCIDFYFDFISPYSYLAHKKIEVIKTLEICDEVITLSSGKKINKI